MTSTFVPRGPSTTHFVPSGTIGPVGTLTPHVALGYYPEGGNVARWDLARWDTASGQWQGAAPLDDVTCDVVSVALTEGRDLPLERFRPGTATLVLNDPEGKYSPWRTAPDPATYATVRVGIDLIVWVDVPGVGTVPRFRGIVQTIEDDFPDEGDRHTVTFHAVDYLGLLAAFDGIEQAPAGDGELPGARLQRITANAGYTGAKAFDAGSLALQPTTLAKNALDEAGLVIDTELGALWCDRAGVLVFRDRNGLVADPHYTAVQAIFGDDPAEISGDFSGDEICYAEIDLASDTDKIKNIVSIANEGGTAVTRQDLTSVSLFQPRTFRRFDLIHQDPAQSPIIAQRHLDFYAYASNRVETLTVDLRAMRDDQRATVLALDTLWRVQVRRRATGFQVVADLQIQGMTETITADAWAITFRTFSASAVFDVGRWDLDLWDHGLWGY